MSFYTDEDIHNTCRAFSKDYDTLSKQEKKQEFLSYKSLQKG